MKKDTPQTVKFSVLARRLKLVHWQTVGVLESLWLFTAINAQDGAIGRYSDEEIAAAIAWQDDAGELIKALVAARFIDRCEHHRLIIHDWADHCPTWLSSNMKKHGREFARAQVAQVVAQDVAQAPTDDLGSSYEPPTSDVGTSYEPPTADLGGSIPAQSSLTQSNKDIRCASRNGGGYPDWFESLWKSYPDRKGRKLGKRKAYEQCRRLQLHANTTRYDDFGKAVRNYHAACAKGETIARDFERFARNDFWLDWLEPATAGQVAATNGKETTAQRLARTLLEDDE